MSGSRALPDLIARLKLDTTDATGGMKRVQDESKKTGDRISGLGGAFGELKGRVGEATSTVGELITPLIGIGAGVEGLYQAFDKTVAPAAEFQQQMVKLVGTAGESGAALGGVSRGILDLAGQVGYGAGQLADGMYLVESAGFHGANGLNVLRYSAMAAKAENADMAEVANAVTTALNAYGLSATSASHVTDVLLTATAQGKMTFQDLAGSLDQVLPSAAAAKINLNEVAAAIATQTAQGTPAAVAATNLSYAIKGLEVPSSTAKQAIEGLGATSTRFANELTTKGLLATLNDLTTLVGKKFPAGSAAYNASISNILGNQEGLNAVLQLSGTHAQTFSANLTGMAGAAGKTQSSFDEMMATVGGKWSKFTAGLQSDAIELGQRALPLIGSAIDGVQGAFTSAVPEILSALDRGSAGVTSWVQDVSQQLDTFTRNTGLKDLAADLKFIWSETHPTTTGGLHGADLQGNRVAPVPQTDDVQAGKLVAQRLGDAIGEAGPALGTGIVNAIEKAISGIDWYYLGKAAAPATYGFLLGLAEEWMNPTNWSTAIAKHPVEGLIGMVSLATLFFGPEELIGGKLAEFLGRIPLVGGILAWVVRSINKLGGPVRALGGMLGKLLSEMGITGLEEFGKAFGRPQLVEDVTRLVGRLTAPFRRFASDVPGFFDSIGIRLLDWAGKIGETLGTGARNAVDGFWTNFRVLWEGIGGENLPAFLNEFKVLGDEIVTTLRNTGSWAMGGLRDGLVAGWDTVSGWLGGVAGRAGGAIGDLSRTLWDAGASLMQGFLDGLKSKWSDVQSFVGGVGDWIKQHKGPLDVDRQLLVPHGGALMAGLHEGILRGWSDVQATITGITGGLARPRQSSVGPSAIAGVGASMAAQLDSRYASAGGAPGAPTPSPASASGITNHFYGIAADPQALAAMVANEQRWAARVTGAYRRY